MIINSGEYPIPIQTVPSQNGSLTYNGGVQSPTWAGYDSSKLSLGGVTSATDAGTYVATFAPKPGFKWPDGTAGARSVSWTIGKQTIPAVPSQNGSLTYNGSAQSPAWNDYSSDQLEIGGDTGAINAGTYTATFTPTGNYQWSDGTNEARSVSWQIGKAAGVLEIEPVSIALTSSVKTADFWFSRPGDGEVSITSSNSGIISVGEIIWDTETSGHVLLTAVNSGSATITVSVAEGSNHFAPESKTCSVSAVLSITPTFTYSGSCQIVNDSDAVISDFVNYKGNWKIRFLTSGTLRFTSLNGWNGKLDLFLVGGGGGGSKFVNIRINERNYWSFGAGGAGGFTNTFKAITVEANKDYVITIGAGGASDVNGGNTTAFGKSSNGGGCGRATKAAEYDNNIGGSGGSGGANGVGSNSSGSPGNSGSTYNDNAGKDGSSAGGTGQGRTTREFGNTSAKLYSSGGAAGRSADGECANNTGDGGRGGALWASGDKGGSGIAIIRNAR